MKGFNTQYTFTSLGEFPQCMLNFPVSNARPACTDTHFCDHVM